MTFRTKAIIRAALKNNTAKTYIDGCQINYKKWAMQGTEYHEIAITRRDYLATPAHQIRTLVAEVIKYEFGCSPRPSRAENGSLKLRWETTRKGDEEQ